MHIINLATQALLSAHSKSKAYNPQEPDTNLIAHRNAEHDEISVIHSVCVKVIIPCCDVYLSLY